MDYKEKLEEAKRFYESANADQKYVLESLFPELAGSESEQIRKELIGLLRNIPNSKYNCEDMALWLEKQWSKEDEEELEIAIDTLKKSGQYDSAKWVQSLIQRIGVKL